MELNKEGIDLVRRFEGFRSRPYLCPAGKPTIGYGMTMYPNGKPVTLQDKPITEAEAVTMLAALLKQFADQVKPLIKVTLTDNQFSALVSFAYNVGIGNFRSSTLLKRLNEQKFDQAANEFLQWSKARVNGVLQPMPGLVKRRIAERALFVQ